jgi:hypothetical protein
MATVSKLPRVTKAPSADEYLPAEEVSKLLIEKLEETYLKDDKSWSTSYWIPLERIREISGRTGLKDAFLDDMHYWLRRKNWTWMRSPKTDHMIAVYFGQLIRETNF